MPRGHNDRSKIKRGPGRPMGSGRGPGRPPGSKNTGGTLTAKVNALANRLEMLEKGGSVHTPQLVMVPFTSPADLERVLGNFRVQAQTPTEVPAQNIPVETGSTVPAAAAAEARIAQAS
jgi:hypothetical protein